MPLKGSKKVQDIHRVRPSADYKRVFKRFDRGLDRHNREGDGYTTTMHYLVKWDGCRSFQSYAKRYIERIP